MKIKKITSPLLTAFFLGLLIWYGLNNKNLFTGLSEVSIGTFMLVAGGKLTEYALNGLFTKWTVEVFTGKMKLTESIYLSILSAIGNYLGPLLGGASIRAIYLKKNLKLSYSRFISTLAGYYLILLTTYILLGIIGLLFLTRATQRDTLIIMYFVSLLVLMPLYFAKIPKRFMGRGSSKIRNYIKEVLEDIGSGWSLIKGTKGLLTKLTFLAVSGFIVTLITALVEFNSIGANLSLASLMVYTSIFAVSMLLSLTPGALGIRETLLILVGSTLAISNEQILQVAIIDRGVNYIVLFTIFILIRIPWVKQRLTK